MEVTWVSKEINGATYLIAENMGPKYTIVKTDVMFKEEPLYSILCLKEFADVKENEFGGFITIDTEISQDDRSWVYPGAIVCNSELKDDSTVEGPTSVIFESELIRTSVGEMESYVNNSKIISSTIKNSEIVGCVIVKGCSIENGTIDVGCVGLSRIAYSGLKRVKTSNNCIDLSKCKLEDVSLTGDIRLNNISATMINLYDCIINDELSSTVHISGLSNEMYNDELQKIITKSLNKDLSKININSIAKSLLGDIGQMLDRK